MSADSISPTNSGQSPGLAQAFIGTGSEGDLTIVSIGGSLTISVTGGGPGEIIDYAGLGVGEYGNLTIGGIGGDLALSASGSGNAFVQTSRAGVDIGNIGGLFSAPHRVCFR